MRFPTTPILMLAGATLLLAGCDDDDSFCSRYESKLRSCYLITAGSIECEEPENSSQRCQADCILGASCTTIEGFLCRGEVGASLAACGRTCPEEGGFRCADGSNTIDENWVCDGEDDCMDGSDEVDCPEFTCADGSATIPESDRCDYWDDCADGSDEEGCPGFDCADGSGKIHEDWVCDGEEDCLDGSDEDDCPERPDEAELICPED